MENVEKNKDIHTLKLHEQTYIASTIGSLHIMRVPSGWLYFNVVNKITTFVPLSNE